jgi:hypothetical protein
MIVHMLVYCISKTQVLQFRLIVNTIIRSCPHSWLITRFVARITRRVEHVEQELFTHPEHLISTHFQWVSCCSIFSFLYNILQIVVCPFSFGHYIVCISWIFGFWLPLWYHQAYFYIFILTFLRGLNINFNVWN